MEVLPATPAGVGRFTFPSELLWKYRMSFPPQMDFRTQLPRNLAGNDPRQWSRESVASFLQWCQFEFDLPQFNMEKFQMNGKALCLLTKSDLAERSPGSGDVLHNVLQMLMRDSTEQQQQPSPLTPHFSPHAWPLLQAAAASVPPPGHLQPLPPPPVSFSVTLSPVPTASASRSTTASTSLKPSSASVNVPRVTLSPAPPTSPCHDNHTQYSHSSLRTDQETQCRSPHSPLEHSSGAGGGSLHPPLTSSPTFRKSELSPNSATAVLQSSCSNTPPHSPNQKPPISHFTAIAAANDHVTSEPNSNGRLLWDFLQQLLNDSQQRYTAYIAWKNQESGVFKIVDPPGLAKLWGIQKNHLSMNYDKMSRALRYYYRVNILRKVQGERHCYQFLRNPSELRSIKNMSLLRQQTIQQSQPSHYVKSEPQETMDSEDIQPTDLSISSSSSSLSNGHPNNNSWSQENVKTEQVENNNNNNVNNNNNSNAVNGKGQDMRLQLNMWTQDNGKMKLASPTNFASRDNVQAIKTEDSS